MVPYGPCRTIGLTHGPCDRLYVRFVSENDVGPKFLFQALWRKDQTGSAHSVWKTGAHALEDERQAGPSQLELMPGSKGGLQDGFEKKLHCVTSGLRRAHGALDYIPKRHAKQVQQNTALMRHYLLDLFLKETCKEINGFQAPLKQPTCPRPLAQPPETSY